MNRNISVNSSEQLDLAEKINQRLGEIARISGKNMKKSMKTSDLGDELLLSAELLSDLVGQFKI